MPSDAVPALREPEDAEQDPRPARSRAVLIEAASRLLAEGGIEAVTIDAVTRVARVSRATLYRHFGSGTELLAAAFERLLPPVPLAPEGGELRERLVALVAKQAELIEQAPLQLTLLSWLGLSMSDTEAVDEDAAVGDRPRLQTLKRRIIAQYREPFDAILSGADTRAGLREDLDTDLVLAQLGGPLIFNRLVTGRPSDAAFCVRLVDDFLAANTRP
ncbi:TetR/AcrR family transcriptional regulator [Saccharopolyspora sp. NPDC049426]|uniref:TetR/AcrR family transcriptional regulator n=1 Tax=Saccharopolyspora sp. NPDC049426 TaxID=3155652 RepID=UPI003424E9AB